MIGLRYRSLGVLGAGASIVVAALILRGPPPSARLAQLPPDASARTAVGDVSSPGEDADQLFDLDRRTEPRPPTDPASLQREPEGRASDRDVPGPSGPDMREVLIAALALSDEQLRTAAIDEIRAGLGDDPQALVKLCATLPHDVVRNNLLTDAVTHWARRDLDATLAWLSTQPEVDLRPAMSAAIGFDLAQTNPAGTWRRLEQTSAFADKDLLLISLVGSWIVLDPAAAAAWAARLSDRSRQEILFAQAVNTGAQIDPVATARYVEALPPQGAARTTAIAALAKQWSYRDPPAAAAWTTSLTPQERQGVWRRVNEKWASIDPHAAGAWLARLPESAEKEVAMIAYADVLAVESPEWAASWVESLPPSAARTRLVDHVTEALGGSDDAGALSWQRTMHGSDRN